MEAGLVSMGVPYAVFNVLAFLFSASMVSFL